MKQLHSFSLLALLLFISTTVSATPASFKLWVGQRSIARIEDLVYPIALVALGNISVPDQHVSAAGINIYLTHLLLQNTTFDRANLQVAFVPPSSLSASLTQLRAVATMNWEYTDGPAIDWKGTAVDTVSEVSLSLSLSVKSDGQGHPAVAITSDALSIGSMNIALSGDGEWLFNEIAKLISPVLSDVLGSALTNTITSELTPLLAKLSTLPEDIKLSNQTTLHLGLDETSVSHALTGSYYTDNHFDSGRSDYALGGEFANGDVGVTMYHSFDVAGFIRVPATGNYSFALSYTQCAELDVNGESIGELETWNVGMCWPERTNKLSDVMSLTAGAAVPIRLRYQSGCGGGKVNVQLCLGSTCNYLDPLTLFSATSDVDTPIEVSDKSVQVALAAEFRPTPPPPSSVSPYPHHEIVDGNETLLKQMIAVGIDEYFINSLFYSLAADGVFNQVITQASLPPSFPFKLNTDTFAVFIPEVAAAYPDTPMQLHLNALDSVTPDLTISSNGGIEVDADFLVHIFVDPTNSTQPVPLFTLAANASATVKAWIEPGTDPSSGNSSCQYVKAVVSELVVTLGEHNDSKFNIPDLVAVFQPFLNGMIKNVVLPAVNEVLGKGIIVPSLSVIELYNTTLTYDDHVMYINSDWDIQIM